MATTKDYVLEDNFHAKILAYGQPSSGKTRFIGTMPEDREDHKGRFILNMEGKNLTPLWMARKKFEWEDIKGYERLLQVIVDLRSRFDRKAPDCPKTVALDGGGEAYAIIMSYIVKNAGCEQPQIQHYYTAQERMKTILSELIALPCHVVVTFHDMIDKDDLTGDIIGNVAVPGKYLPNEILKKFNMTLHFETEPAAVGKEPVYKVCTKKTRRYPAGDKTGCLDTYETPDFGVMYEKITKKLKDIKPKT